MVDTAVEVPARAGRVRRGALAGLVGALLGFVGWGLTLSDPAVGSGLWFIGSTIGEISGLGIIGLVLAMYATREAAGGSAGRAFLALWALGLVIMAVGGVVALVQGNDNTILFPIGFIASTLGSLIASILIACNRRLIGLRRWAPLLFTVGSLVAGFFEGDHHTLKVNLADLAISLLTLVMAYAFFRGVRGQDRS